MTKKDGDFNGSAIYSKTKKHHWSTILICTFASVFNPIQWWLFCDQTQVLLASFFNPVPWWLFCDRSRILLASVFNPIPWVASVTDHWFLNISSTIVWENLSKIRKQATCTVQWGGQNIPSVKKLENHCWRLYKTGFLHQCRAKLSKYTYK